MSNVEDIIVKSALELGVKIGDVIKAKGIDDTGLSQQFDIKINENKVELIGVHYLEYLDRGRGPNKDQSVEGLRNWALWYGENVLKPWAERKGIIFSNYFGLALHIATTGNGIYKDKSKGIELDKLIDEMKESIYDNIGDAAVKDVKKFLKI